MELNKPYDLILGLDCEKGGNVSRRPFDFGENRVIQDSDENGLILIKSQNGIVICDANDGLSEKGKLKCVTAKLVGGKIAFTNSTNAIAKYGLADVDGTVLIKPKFEDITVSPDGQIFGSTETLNDITGEATVERRALSAENYEAVNAPIPNFLKFKNEDNVSEYLLVIDNSQGPGPIIIIKNKISGTVEVSAQVVDFDDTTSGLLIACINRGKLHCYGKFGSYYLIGDFNKFQFLFMDKDGKCIKHSSLFSGSPYDSFQLKGNFLHSVKLENAKASLRSMDLTKVIKTITKISDNVYVFGDEKFFAPNSFVIDSLIFNHEQRYATNNDDFKKILIPIKNVNDDIVEIRGQKFKKKILKF